MCNAAKHPSGCSCGFGPPYPPEYGSAEVSEWSEEALDNSNIVPRGLREMAWDAESIQEFIDRYTEIRSSDLPRDTMISRIRKLLGLRKIVEESVTADWINVPLYRFGAPPVPSATVEYSEGASFIDSGGWMLKVFGIGAGNSTTLQVSKSRSFIATAGICKLVFIPIQLRVARVAVYNGKRFIGRGYQAEVASPKEAGDEHMRRRGCKTLPKDACIGGPREYIDVLDCTLSGDTSTTLHRDRRSWETDTAREVSVHLSQIADVSALVRVRRTRKLELTFSLPAGHDYRAYLCHGVTWWATPV